MSVETVGDRVDCVVRVEESSAVEKAVVVVVIGPDCNAPCTIEVPLQVRVSAARQRTEVF